MSTKTQAIQRIEACSTDHVAVTIWEAEDVLHTAEEMGVTITTTMADEILDNLESNHDAEHGISWFNVRYEIEDYLASSDRVSEKNHNG
jgi:hypothetical protein